MNLDQLLSDAAQRVADHVDPPEVDLDAVRSRAHRARRRKVASALAAAAAVTATIVGIPLLADRGTPAPMPAGTPPTGILRTIPDSDCALGRCLEPGAYGLHLGQSLDGDPLRARLTVAGAGWDADGPVHGVWQGNGNDYVLLAVYLPREFASGAPCSGVTTQIAPRASLDEVVRALVDHPQLAVVDGPRALPAFGRDTRYLQMQADRVSCPDVDGAQDDLADLYGGDGLQQGAAARIDFDRPVFIEFWVADLEGEPVVVEARQEGAPDASMVERLDRVRESLSFTVPR